MQSKGERVGYANIVRTQTGRRPHSQNPQVGSLHASSFSPLIAFPTDDVLMRTRNKMVWLQRADPGWCQWHTIYQRKSRTSTTRPSCSFPVSLLDSSTCLFNSEHALSEWASLMEGQFRDGIAASLDEHCQDLNIPSHFICKWVFLFLSLVLFISFFFTMFYIHHIL